MSDIENDTPKDKTRNGMKSITELITIVYKAVSLTISEIVFNVVSSVVCTRDRI
jgi:hypothetical protein